MPANRAAKRNPRKAAKKLVHHPVNDLRRAYEHLGRIEILEGALAGSPFVDVAALSGLAQQQLEAAEYRNAANLLRAAEHMCFAALAPSHASDSPSDVDLERALTMEFENLMRRSEEHWQQHEEPSHRRIIEDLFARALDQARRAFDRGAFRPALEFARAADALSHIASGLPATMPDRMLIGRLAS